MLQNVHIWPLAYTNCDKNVVLFHLKHKWDTEFIRLEARQLQMSINKVQTSFSVGDNQLASAVTTRRHADILPATQHWLTAIAALSYLTIRLTNAARLAASTHMSCIEQAALHTSKFQIMMKFPVIQLTPTTYCDIIFVTAWPTAVGCHQLPHQANLATPRINDRLKTIVKLIITAEKIHAWPQP